MKELEIKGFIETSFLDWDGHIVSVVFLPYCNFRCPFCHNAGLIENSDTYETIPVKKVFDFLLSHKDFIDGVCITGGEPCLHKELGLLAFLQEIKKMGFKIKLDTNGCDPEFLKKIIEDKLIDFVAMDLKEPLDERYSKIAGAEINLDKINQSVKILMGEKVAYEFRTTVVPTLLEEEDILDIANKRGAEICITAICAKELPRRKAS